MPIPILAEAVFNGLSSIPFVYPLLKLLPWLGLVYLLKVYFGGASNTSERLMHSKVVMITGGTSGVGAAVALALAQRGAQIILLTHYPPSDPFLVDYIEDLRSQTSNELIYAEQVDLSDLHSIRRFATRWVDNAPPRRLDLLILCAATMTAPLATAAEKTGDGLEVNWAVNYLANFHLLSILSPAIRAQPADRDVRVLMATCATYIGAQLEPKTAASRASPRVSPRASTFSSRGVYGSSKLALMVFAQSFQQHLDAYQRPDKQPMNARVIVVDPGWSRTPGMRRWLTAGSLWGLMLYLITWPLWWLVLKSPAQGAQSFLRAAMEAELGTGHGGKMIKECREVVYARSDIKDESVAKALWQQSEEQIQRIEKEGAVRRALQKKETEEEEAAKSAGTNGQPAATTRSSKSSEKTPGSRRSRKAG
ncbi:MAG: hypothetical protein M1838_002904 [Thelocarpon superellum]|nr:MAG: hypothetical protein M1838_002904 [Thelocarpon superellum]